jgi:hypothetical protein
MDVERDRRGGAVICNPFDALFSAFLADLRLCSIYLVLRINFFVSDLVSF